MSTANNPFHKKAGNFITHADAHTLVKNYEDQNANKKETVVRAIFYGSDKIQELLDTEGAVGIRVYYGLHANPGIGQPYSKKMVLVAVDKDGYDIPGSPNIAPDPNAPVSKSGTPPKYLDDGVPCPDQCPPPPKGIPPTTP